MALAVGAVLCSRDAVDTDSERPIEPLLISLKDAGAIIGLNYYGFYDLVASGTIPTVYQGRRRYVTPQALRDYVASLSSLPPSPRC